MHAATISLVVKASKTTTLGIAKESMFLNKVPACIHCCICACLYKEQCLSVQCKTKPCNGACMASLTNCCLVVVTCGLACVISI